MFKTVERPDAPAAIRMDIGAIFVSLELSRSTWLLTSVSPGAAEKMSQHATPAGDLRRLFECLAELKRKALARTGKTYPIIVIQEAGLDGIWIHRALEREGIESTSSTLLRSPCRAGVDGPRPIASTARRCFAR
jgi:transposase